MRLNSLPCSVRGKQLLRVCRPLIILANCLRLPERLCRRSSLPPAPLLATRAPRSLPPLPPHRQQLHCPRCSLPPLDVMRRWLARRAGRNPHPGDHPGRRTKPVGLPAFDRPAARRRDPLCRNRDQGMARVRSPPSSTVYSCSILLVFTVQRCVVCTKSLHVYGAWREWTC